jgi:hypothetical protein
MCNVLSCVYPGAQPGRRHNVRILKIIPIGTAMLKQLSHDAIAFEGEYDFNDLVYRGKGTFRFGCHRQTDGRWRLILSFRGTWAADFDILAGCRESGGDCTFEGTGGDGVRSRVVLGFTKSWPIGNSIVIDVDRPNWSVPTLSFFPQ